MSIFKTEFEKIKSLIRKEPTAWERVKTARLLERPTSLFYINRIFDNFIELHGDRNFGDDPGIVCGIGKLVDTPVTIIGIQKGRNTKENIKRNFGMPNPEGYRKALRFMKQAEKFKRPVICFIDTPGAFCGVGAEERGQGEAIARNLFEMSTLKTPIISLLIGEGGSGGALALAVADKVLMLENSIYSVLSPEGFASILWKDGSRAAEASEVMKITAADLKKLEVVDEVIKEPQGGAHKDPDKMASTIKAVLVKEVKNLRGFSIDQLVDMRYKRFRKFGEYKE